MHSSIVEKLFVVLSVLSKARSPMSFSDIVTQSGLNKSTVHRLLAIAGAQDLARFDSYHKVYAVGPRIFEMARTASLGQDIQAMALEEMLRLHTLTDANVTVGIPSGHEVVYLRVLESPQSLGGVQRPGMRDPVHCTASGKALMAFLPDEVVAAHMKSYAFEQRTNRTITSMEAFLATLHQVRQDGYAFNDREEYDQFIGIAAPVFNYMAEPVAVLNIWTAAARHSKEELLGWAPDLMASAAKVTELMGGVAPPST